LPHDKGIISDSNDSTFFRTDTQAINNSVTTT
jgi:hypothetical protein